MTSRTTPTVEGPIKGRLVRALLDWYDAHKRDLPWRRTADPYAVWLSEVMLQQTRVDTVIPYYERFLAAYPTVAHLAAAPLSDVLTLWSGLGYYRRARMLHAAASEVAEDHGGVLPGTAEGLRALHGVGAYTAGAVASIAFGERAPLVDGNVARVFARLFALEQDVRRGGGLAKVWALAAELVPAQRPGDFNQALMELGATVCTPRDPACLVCPVRDVCAARSAGRERQLPVVTARARAKVERRTALVVSTADGVVLARRAPEGTFGGMWEPPSVPAGDDATARLLALVGLSRSRRAPEGLRSHGAVVHVLTHRRLEVAVLSLERKAAPASLPSPPEGTGYDCMMHVTRGRLSGLPLTTFSKKLLRAAASPRLATS